MHCRDGEKNNKKNKQKQHTIKMNLHNNSDILLGRFHLSIWTVGLAKTLTEADQHVWVGQAGRNIFKLGQPLFLDLDSYRQVNQVT